MATFRAEKSSIRMDSPTFLTGIHKSTTLNKRGREKMKLTKSMLECYPFAIKFAENSFHTQSLIKKTRHQQPCSNDDACRTYRGSE